MGATSPSRSPQVAVLTGGGDRPYALGLARGLIAAGASIDFIGSDFLKSPEVVCNPAIHFLNLRGDMRPEARFTEKLFRVARYYARLLRYAAVAKPAVFHILWNNKLEFFDRTLLMLYYRALGKRIVVTVHNVNMRERDANDSVLNRLTLRAQYRLADHLFVHTALMKQQLQKGFGVANTKITVIPFALNDTVPLSSLSSARARELLGLSQNHKVMLFFGSIAPYKGLDVLIAAMAELAKSRPELRLVIAGRPKGAKNYWASIETCILELGLEHATTRRIEFVPDEDTEIFFKAADLLVLPYTRVFHSGVLFLGYNFGLPVVASDVGGLRDDVVEGTTGFVCRPGDARALALTIDRYFDSDLYLTPSRTRPHIRSLVLGRHAWERVASTIFETYRALLRDV